MPSEYELEKCRYFKIGSVIFNNACALGAPSSVKICYRIFPFHFLQYLNVIVFFVKNNTSLVNTDVVSEGHLLEIFC